MSEVLDSGDKKYDVGRKEFDLFKKYAKMWQRKLGMVDWSLAFDHRDEKEDENLGGNKAIVYMNRQGMCARMVLNKSWKEVRPTDIHLKACALHECVEMLLRPLLTFANARFNVDEGDIEYETHRIIRVLENVLVYNKKGN